MDKQVETYLDEIKEKLLARGTGVQKAGFAEKTAHKMYTKMVQNAPETIWAAFQVTDECAAVESAPEYALPAASNWKINMPSTGKRDVRRVTPVFMPVPKWQCSLPFPSRKRIQLNSLKGGKNNDDFYT